MGHPQVSRRPRSTGETPSREPAGRRRYKDPSVQAEHDLDADLDGNWSAIFQGGSEAPPADSFRCFFVEAHAERARDTEFAGAAFGVDDGPEHHTPLVFSLASFFRVFGIRIVDGVWRGNASSNPVDSAPDTA